MAEKMVHTFKTLVKTKKKILEDIMKAGTTPDLESMVWWEFDGYNLTKKATILGIRKFRKGFYREQGFVKGYNVRMKQNNFKKPWKYKNEQNPERFGWFDILPASVFKFEKGKTYYHNAVLLHYGLDDKNTLFQGKMLRDFLVQANKDDKDLYLGKAYNAVGQNLVMPSYFVLKRAEKITL